MRAPWSNGEGEEKKMNLSAITEWLKFVVIVSAIASTIFGAGFKLVARINAVPVLEQDVKKLKRQVRFIVRGVEKLTRTRYKDEEAQDSDE